MESTAAHLIQQSDEVERLSKELDKCKADKEFVWGLWKKLQKTNPDLNAAIEMIVEREKSNHQQRVDQLIEYGHEKETQIEKLNEDIKLLGKRLEQDGEDRKRVQLVNQELSVELTTLRDVLCTASNRLAGYEEMEREYNGLKERNKSIVTEFDVIKQQTYTQECIMKSEISDLSERIRGLVLENSSMSSRAVAGENRCRDMQGELGEFGRRLQEVSEECSKRVEATRKLDELLSLNREKLQLKEDEMERVRRENEVKVSECVSEGERHRLCIEETRVLIKQLEGNLREKEDTLKQNLFLNEVLNNKVMDVERENSHLKEVIKELESFKLNIRQIQHCNTSSQTTRDVLSLYSNTSLEVVVQLLESRSVELEQIRRSHDRRLTRYKELQTAHKLLKDQLSTYAPDSILSVPKQSDTEERVLNEGVAVDTTHISSEAYTEVSCMILFCINLSFFLILCL